MKTRGIKVIPARIVAAEKLVYFGGGIYDPSALTRKVSEKMPLIGLKAKLITVWAVHQGDNDRSSGSPRWWFSNKITAQQYSLKRGWYGGDAPISEHKVIVIPAEVTESGKVEYYLADTKVDVDGREGLEDEKLKEQALAKLTPEEKRVLRLDK